MPDSEATVLQHWVDIVQTLTMTAIAVYVWVVSRHRVDPRRIDDFDTTVDALTRLHDDLTRRQASLIETIGQRIDRMPQHETIARIFQRLDDLHGDIRELGGRMDGVSRTLDGVSQHLLREKE